MKKMEVNFLIRSILGIPLLNFCKYFSISSAFEEPSSPRFNFGKIILIMLSHLKLIYVCTIKKGWNAIDCNLLTIS